MIEGKDQAEPRAIENQKSQIKNSYMPYQDHSDLPIHVPRQPGVAERWLRKVFVEDLNTKLLALGITLVLWFAVTGQKTPMTTRIAGVQLNFVLPEDMEIANDPPGKIDVTLTGSKDRLTPINTIELVATVSVGDLKPGDRVVRLSADRVKLQLPEGVHVERFQPATISLRLEPRAERTVAVGVKIEGKVPEGYEVYTSSANPAVVRLRGPVDHLNAIEKAPTESISVDGRKESFDVAQTSIDIPDQKIDVMDTVVTVHVEIDERAIERIFNGVQVRLSSGGDAQPRVADIHVSGPPKICAQLRGDDIKVVVDANGNNPRLELPPAMQSKVRLTSIKPLRFSASK
jgi:YbbR domain-containing protein